MATKLELEKTIERLVRNIDELKESYILENSRVVALMGETESLKRSYANQSKDMVKTHQSNKALKLKVDKIRYAIETVAALEIPGISLTPQDGEELGSLSGIVNLLRHLYSLSGDNNGFS